MAYIEPMSSSVKKSNIYRYFTRFEAPLPQLDMIETSYNKHQSSYLEKHTNKT